MKNYRNYLIIVICFIGIILIFKNPVLVKNSVYEAIIISGEKIIPSLLPIIFIITIMVNSGVIFTVSNKLMPIFLFLISQISGYPIGAKLLNSAAEIGFIDKKDARKILPSMICAGPAFIISFVGGTLFGNEKIGIRLYLAILISNFILFVISGGLSLKFNKLYIKTELRSTFIDSIFKSAESVFKISILFIFFYTFINGCSDFLNQNIKLLFSFVFEVIDCVMQSKNIYVTCMALSWSGICVHLQICSFANKLQIKYFYLAINRLAAAAISVFLLKISMKYYPLTINVYSGSIGNKQFAFGGNIGFIIVLFLSVFVLLISLYKKEHILNCIRIRNKFR